MRILFVNYMATSLPTMIRSFELARAVATRGHDVVLAFMNPAFRPPAWFRAQLEAARGGRPDLRLPAEDAGRSGPVAAAGAGASGAAGRVTDARPSALGLLRQAVGSMRYVAAERALYAEVRPDVVVARPDQVFSFLRSSRSARIPLVLDTDGPVEELDHYWGIRSRGFRGLDAWRARRAAALLHISRVTGDLWRSKGIPEERLFLAPNGADPEVFRPAGDDARRATRSALGLEGRRVVGFSGNQRAWHGVGELLRAMVTLCAKDSDLRLLLIGSIEDRSALRLGDLPPRLVEERVVFTGAVPYAEMPRHLDAADVLALPYPPLPLFHFSPMKMFEALALAKPIVASRQGQIGELLDGLPSARLYDPAVPGALAGAIEAGFALPCGAGAASRGFLEGAHTWAHRGAQVEAACRLAAARSRSGA
jgi:glycosyltransferase involved in cell wall biosynthesis